MTQATVLAHGLGGSTDLPIPPTFALIGAAWALTLTFVVVAFAWRTARFDTAAAGREMPRLTALIDSVVVRRIAGGVALVLAVWVVVLALTSEADNPLPGVFYVLLWVGLPVLSAMSGPLWRVLSPVRMLWPAGRAARRYPENWGYLPAAAGLFAFVWLELASPDPGASSAILLWLGCYAVVMVVGGAVFGPRWFARADPFDVYSVTASRLSPFRRSSDSTVVFGSPFHHLPSLPVRRGTVTVLAVLLGSTAFDSFSAMPVWRAFVDDLGGGAWGGTAVATVGLAVFITVVGVSFWGAARATGGLDAPRRRLLPGQLAHSLIPIVMGYVLAHYLSYLVERGQQTLILLLRPMGLSWDVVYVLSEHPGVLATVKVGAVVLGHMAGVVAAHDAALRLLPKGHQLTGQLAMMLVMVAYTFTGLYLLFGG